MIAPQTSPKVIVIARMLSRFSRDELTQLVKLVPALREVQSTFDEELVAYFRQLGQEQRGGQPANPDDPFIGGLTYAQYFALSETEQDAIWDQIFAEAALDMDSMAETDVAPDAHLPTR